MSYNTLDDIDNLSMFPSDIKEIPDKLFKNLPGIFFLQDEDGNYILWNKHFEVASGYSTEEIKSINGLDFFREEDRERVRIAIRKVFVDGFAEMEVVVISKEGKVIPFFLKARSINYQGKPCLIGTAIDISELKQAQQEITKSEEKYRSLFEQASDAIMVTDFQGNFLDVNESLCKMFGYTKDELMHMKIFDLLDKEELKAKPMSFDRLAEGHHVFSRRKMIHRDGTFVEVEANVKKISESSVLAIARNINARIKVENELAESENRLRVIFETDPDCIKLLDANLCVIQMNPAGLKMLDAESLKQVVGQCVIPLVDEEYRDSFRNEIAEVFKGNSRSLEFGITSMKGNKRWMEMNAVPLRNNEGGIICALALSRDITERKHAEEAIRHSEAKYKLLFNRNPMPMWMLSIPDLHIIDVNDAAILQYGYSREEFLKMTPKDLRPEEEYERYYKAKTGEYSGVNNLGIWVHKRKNGSLIKVEIIIHDILYENRPTRLVLSKDVTERLLAEEKLRESEFQFRKVTENDILGVAWALPDGKLMNANNTFCKMLGYKLDELKGVYFGDFTHPEDTKKELKLIEQILNGERDNYSIEKRYKTKSGDYIWVELNLSFYRKVTENTIDFFIGFVQNINERKKAEEELSRSHDELRRLSSHLETIREEERTSIAREIHDELGQQLTGLRMDASWLNKKVNSGNKAVGDKITEMISLIDDTVKTVRRISSDLRPGILDDLGLVDALQWQSTEFEKRTGIVCIFESTVSDSHFEKKLSTGIFRVYQETLTNVARHAQATEINTTLECTGDSLLLRVHDNGKGFDETEIKRKKTLGFVGMKERAKMFGGEVMVNSSIGGGTEIILRVPMIALTEKEQIK